MAGWDRRVCDVRPMDLYGTQTCEGIHAEELGQVNGLVDPYADPAAVGAV